jgi:hypothetical protein
MFRLTSLHGTVEAEASLLRLLVSFLLLVLAVMCQLAWSDGVELSLL